MLQFRNVQQRVVFGLGKYSVTSRHLLNTTILSPLKKKIRKLDVLFLYCSSDFLQNFKKFYRYFVKIWKNNKEIK